MHCSDARRARSRRWCEMDGRTRQGSIEEEKRKEKKSEKFTYPLVHIYSIVRNAETRQENQVPISGKIFCLTFNQLFVEFVLYYYFFLFSSLVSCAFAAAALRWIVWWVVVREPRSSNDIVANAHRSSLVYLLFYGSKVFMELFDAHNICVSAHRISR